MTVGVPSYPPADDKPEPDRKRQQVEDWRELQLLRAGYQADDAIELSRRRDVDLHRAVALIEGGCEPHIAAEILR
jgi:hypothetical protein